MELINSIINYIIYLIVIVFSWIWDIILKGLECAAEWVFENLDAIIYTVKPVFKYGFYTVGITIAVIIGIIIMILVAYKFFMLLCELVGAAAQVIFSIIAFTIFVLIAALLI